jgi:hypothetical protein
MSKGNTLENDLLKLIFQAAGIANLADNAGADPLANLYVSLHSANPGEGGAQNTSEVAYTGYARVAVARSALGWDVAANVASNLAIVAFPECSALSATAAYVGIGTSDTGAGKLLYYGQLGAPLAISAGITPQFAAGVLQISED